MSEPRGLRCNVSKKYFYQNFFCCAKSFNRSCSTETEQRHLCGTFLWEVFVEPSHDFFDFLFLVKIETRLQYKYGTIYREVMHGPMVTWCEMTKDHWANLIVVQLMKIFEASFPGLIHPCPYYIKSLIWNQVQTFIFEIFKEVDFKHRPFQMGSLMSIFPSYHQTKTRLAKWKVQTKDIAVHS